jgi:hypothetical protein
MRRYWSHVEDKLPKFAVILAISFPLIQWGFESIRASKLIVRSPYGLSEISLILLTSLLMVIHSKITEINVEKSTGDETKIIMNRNESDYYEIWREVRSFRDVSIEAVGHSFNTLWFNFIKKFLQEVISNTSAFDAVSVKLVSTVKERGAFDDILAFYGLLDSRSAERITIELIRVPPFMLFFTGLCVNKGALWLSIREPHRVVKPNEHVREWRRETSQSAEKIVNWYLGIVTFLESKSIEKQVLARGKTTVVENRRHESIPGMAV